MKLFSALMDQSNRRDNTPMERLEYSHVKTTIEAQCERYLHNSGDVLRIEALPSAIDATIACMESLDFLEKYEFQQVSETCFDIRLHELELL